MSTLLLRLAGPLQAWGDGSRFTRRDTATTPTKSGVLGLLAAAQGRRRTDPLEDLVGLRFGVRVDQPGRLVTDFQTAIDWAKKVSMPLSYRYYLEDAVFVAGVEGDSDFLRTLREALLEPAYPLYLGRRSCPVTGQLILGMVDRSLEQALREVPWQAAHWYRRSRRKDPPQHLTVVVDVDPQTIGPVETVRDVPISFDVARRQYGWRDLERLQVPNPDPASREVAVDRLAPGDGLTDDLFATVEEAQ